MDEEIERLIVSVRADTSSFARDVAAMRAELDGPFAARADRAGRAVEVALARAVRTGKLGFEDLKRMVLSTMVEIAASSIQGGLAAILGGGKGAGGLIASLAAALAGAPGRATGGPVAPGRPYLVGERGPELFVPTASGRVETLRGGPARDVRLSITVNAPAGGEAGALRSSSRQVAQAVRRALLQMED
jgi:phage-related minor tail protein